METYDLEIANYNLEDILNLFNLSYNFTKDDLKGAQRKAYTMHPDKSKLPATYFIFFMKAYTILKEIYNFRFRQKQSTPEDTIYKTDMNEEQKIILDNIKHKNKADFHEWFNKMFEKIKISDDIQDTGYETWFRSHEDDVSPKRVALSQFDSEFEKRKKECKKLALVTSLEEMGGKDGYVLMREKPKSYSSDLFSKLPYEDLKRAHTETVVPVTRADYIRKQKFSNVDTYRSFRQGQDTTPLSLQQSKEFLSQKMQNDVVSDTQRIYKILKQDEKIVEGNKRLWGFLKQITNE